MYTEVENSVDLPTVAQKFAAFFSGACIKKAQELRCQYMKICDQLTVFGLPLTEEHIIDSELVNKVIFNLHMW